MVVWVDAMHRLPKDFMPPLSSRAARRPDPPLALPRWLAAHAPGQASAQALGELGLPLCALPGPDLPLVLARAWADALMDQAEALGVWGALRAAVVPWPDGVQQLTVRWRRVSHRSARRHASQEDLAWMPAATPYEGLVEVRRHPDGDWKPWHPPRESQRHQKTWEQLLRLHSARQAEVWIQALEGREFTCGADLARALPDPRTLVRWPIEGAEATLGALPGLAGALPATAQASSPEASGRLVEQVLHVRSLWMQEATWQAWQALREHWKAGWPERRQRVRLNPERSSSGIWEVLSMAPSVEMRTWVKKMNQEWEDFQRSRFGLNVDALAQVVYTLAVETQVVHNASELPGIEAIWTPARQKSWAAAKLAATLPAASQSPSRPRF